jgi:hypothetical protein
LPHSEITGSSLLSSSPMLIAALHVLRRLWNQGIHLYALINFRLRKIAPIHSGLKNELAAFICLTHESSSLYSFQRSLVRLLRHSAPHDPKIASAPHSLRSFEISHWYANRDRVHTIRLRNETDCCQSTCVELQSGSFPQS